jgi:subtilisin family serine protease
VRRRIIFCMAFLVMVSSCGFAYDPRPNKPHKIVVVSTPILMPKGKTKTVAVIDTGIAKPILDLGREMGICKFGHKDFTGEGVIDVHGHGTNVSGLIHRGAAGSDYCQVIIKYYSKNATNQENVDREMEAIAYAIAIKVDYINISGGGVNPFLKEKVLIEKALAHGIKVIAAAGNEKSDLLTHTFYPAMYDDRIIVVGNGTDEEHKAKTSNYGDRVDAWRDGEKQTAFGITETGTSQSTAIYTGELIKTDYLKAQEKSHVQRGR